MTEHGQKLIERLEKQGYTSNVHYFLEKIDTALALPIDDECFWVISMSNPTPMKNYRYWVALRDRKTQPIEFSVRSDDLAFAISEAWLDWKEFKGLTSE